MSKLSVKVLGMLLAGAFLVGGCGTDYKAELEKAQGDLQKGNYQQAKPRFELILKESDDPKLKKAAEMGLDVVRMMENNKEIVEAEVTKRKEIEQAFDEKMSVELKNTYKSCEITGDYTVVTIYIDDAVWKNATTELKKQFIKDAKDMYLKTYKHFERETSYETVEQLLMVKVCDQNGKELGYDNGVTLNVK